MGVVLDSTILIASERKRETVKQLIERLQPVHGETEAAISTISLVELTHGIYRARTDADRERRQLFTEELCLTMFLHPLTLEIARLAGRIEGDQAARGFTIPFEDLIIGCTALHLDFSIATLNTRTSSSFPASTSSPSKRSHPSK